LYRVILTDEQRSELKRRAHRRDIRPQVRDRLEMVRLSDNGLSVPQIGDLLDVHEQTVRRWIKSFLTGGLDALQSQPSGGVLAGKVSAFTPEMIAALAQEIEQGKRTWSAPQMADWVDATFGVRLSPARIGLHMKRAGLVYKRTNRTLKHKQKVEEVSAKQTTLSLLKGGQKAGSSMCAISTRRASA
jgi:transposase